MYITVSILFFRDKTICVFMFGDYELLGVMYGLSGSSGKFGNTIIYVIRDSCMHFLSLLKLLSFIILGRHCCLWCTIECTCSFTIKIALFVILGSHCCLWCTITYDGMKLSKEKRNNVQPRTLESLQTYYL